MMLFKVLTYIDQIGGKRSRRNPKQLHHLELHHSNRTSSDNSLNIQKIAGYRASHLHIIEIIKDPESYPAGTPEITLEVRND